MKSLLTHQKLVWTRLLEFLQNRTDYVNLAIIIDSKDNARNPTPHI